MLQTNAEKSFSKGLAALASSQPLVAADCFLDAMQAEERQQARRPDMRYLSYYGLSLARANRVTHAAIEACERAVRHDPLNPLLLLNLGRVQEMAGRRVAALSCFHQGLKLAPDHRALRLALGRVERRSPPAISFLDRSHALNRWLGRLRGSLRARPA